MIKPFTSLFFEYFCIMKKVFLTIIFAFSLCLICGAQKYRHILLRDFRTVKGDEVVNFNIGTSAHGPGTLNVLKKYLPDDVEITIWASKPLEPSLARMMARRFPDTKIVHGSFCNPGKASPELKEAIDKADLFLISSGSGISPSIIPSLEDFMKYTDTPVGAYAIGYNSGQNQYLKDMDFAWFRDEISAIQAKKAPTTPAITGWAPDAVFDFDCTDDKAAKRFLRQNGLKRGKYICCIPGFRHTPSAGLSEEKRKTNDKYLERDNAILRRTITEAVRKFGVKVLICAEQLPEVALCKDIIYDKLPEDVKSQCVYVKELWSPDLALGVYKQALCVYGIEMHSQVMALGNGTPACIFRHSVFRNKSDMWKTFGVGDWLLDIDDEDATAKACSIVNSILADPDGAQRKVKRAREIADSANRIAITQSFYK